MKLICNSKKYINKNNTVEALKDISLEFSNQGMTFIIGESGCGKSTLLKILAGRDTDFDGHLDKDGKVEYIGQHIELFENLTVLDNLLMINSDTSHVNQLLEQFDLLSRSKTKVKKLSGGEKKRVQVIRSFLVSPDYLLCDEPTASLDFENAIKVMECLKLISENVGVIIVTHSLSIVDQYSERTIRMGKGTILNDEPSKYDGKPMLNLADNKSLIQKSKWAIKNLFSRKIELAIDYILLFATLLLVFFATTIFSSLNKTMIGTENWSAGRNIIESIPNDGNDQFRYFQHAPNSSNHQWLYYDLYSSEEPYIVHDILNDILAYQRTWGKDKALLQDTSYIPFVGKQAYIDFAKKAQKKLEETGEIPFPQYYEWESNISGALSSMSEDYKMPSFIEFLGYNSDVVSNNLYGPEIFSEILSIERGHSFEVEWYQLFDDIQFIPDYGSLPQTQREVMITKSIANRFLDQLGLNNYDELIGKTVDYRLDANTGVFYPNKENSTTHSFTICGITMYDYENEIQVFFKDGTIDAIYEAFFNYDSKAMNLTNLKFVCSPNADVSSYTTNINQLLGSNESQFVAINSLPNARQEVYQNASIMLGFTAFGFLAILVLYMFKQLLLKNRINKENQILDTYQYSSIQTLMIKKCFLLFIVSITQYSVLSTICEKLNHLASSFQLPRIINYNLSFFFISLLITGILIALLEGGIYAIRTKHH